MLTVEVILKYYFATVTVLGGLVVLLGTKYTLRTWRGLPKTKWLAPSLAMALLALILASTAELPALILGNWILLALIAGVAEESVKLLPIKLYRELENWGKWKLVIGTAFLLGLIEGVLYTSAIVLFGENIYLALVRIVLIGFHTIWAVVSAGFLLGHTGPRRFSGLAFAILAHAFYDMPTLAGFGGYSANAVAAVVVVSTVFMLLTPAMVKRAAELVRTEAEERGGKG
ncbi:hypothetical protein [Thermococcus sp.]|uniref:hypothetical protein n=1 Tax=Thermococcus sp. TaxID=35749 RepID=UPI00263247B9|nr:hypothetical protein [Thermococcus sp.]